jgi:hypothetical protein
MTPNTTNYPTTCDLCGAPARTETITGDIIGVEQVQVCVNEACPHFDIWIVAKRGILEAEVRESAAYRRKHERFYVRSARIHARRQRKVRQAVAAIGR